MSESPSFDFDAEMSRMHVDIDAWMKVSARLLSSSVYVLARIETTDDGSPSPVLIAIEDPEGPVLPVFTSEDGIKSVIDARPELPESYVRVPCSELFAAVVETRVLLNPYHPFARMISPEEVATLVKEYKSSLS